MPSNKKSESRDETNPRQKKKLKSNQPSIETFFNPSIHPSSPNHGDSLTTKPDDQPFASGSSTTPISTLHPSSKHSADDQKTQIEIDEALARSLAGDDDQSYYHPSRKKQSPPPLLQQVSSSTSSQIKSPHPITPHRKVINTFPSKAENRVEYPLDLDILEFEPKLIDTSSWPEISSAISPRKKAPMDTSMSDTQKIKKMVPYSFLVAGFVFISSTRSRLVITSELVDNPIVFLSSSLDQDDVISYTP